MLYEFISAHRPWLLERARQLREARAQRASDPKMEQGFALFLDQLIDSLHTEQEKGAYSSAAISGPASGIPSQSQIGAVASAQGSQMHALGISVDDLVHSYGDLCHAIVDLANDKDVRFDVNEFRLLNHCLDNAIATAVTEFTFQRDSALTAASERDEQRRLAELADQFRKHLGTATTAIAALKARELTLGGVTGTILERSLMSLNAMIDELPLPQPTAHAPAALLDLFSLSLFLEQVKETLAPCAEALSRRLTLANVDPKLALNGGRDALQVAVIGLLQACFIWTREGDDIALHGYARGKRILVDIVCPPGQTRPADDDPALLVARQLLLSHDGKLMVHDNVNDPFTLSISLPRHNLPT